MVPITLTLCLVLVVGFIYSFKNLKVLLSLFINAVKYVACGQIFYSVVNANQLGLVPLRCHSNQLSRHQETRCLCDFFFTESYDIFLGKTVYPILPQSTPLQNRYLALIRQCLELVRYMLPTAQEYPTWDWNGFRVYRPARGGRSCEHFGGY